MLERLKKGLVESFIGAIALGWVFAQGIFHFTYGFSRPVERWLMQPYNCGLAHDPTTLRGLFLQVSLPQLAFHDDTSDTKLWLWRVEPEQLAIQLSDRDDGVKQLTYLKFGTTSSHIPSAHIYGDKDTAQKQP
jgi:hypothetical protein